MSDIAALVAENLEIWTGAIERKSGAGRSGGKRINLYGIERLRALILDLAVRGKLVRQDPADGSAAELLRQIDKARPRLVDGGYIARSKAEVDRTSPAAQFAIPATWAWVRLERLGAIVGGGTPRSTDQSCFADSGGGTPWLTPADLSGFAGKYIERGNRDLTERGLGSSSAKVMPKGTVLFTSRAPIGYVAISANPISTNQGFKSVVPSIDGLSEFIAMVLSAFAEAINENAPGTTFKEVSGKIVSAIAFPLPPLAEQHRIVARVDELMALCDALERESADSLAAHQKLVETLLATLVNSADASELAANWARLESHFDTLFTTEVSIDALKQTILDLAVRGKLTVQDASDESAAKSIDRIHKLKQELIRKKELRKDKAVPPVSEEDTPFEVPSGWLWCRIGMIALSTEYGTSRKATKGGDGVNILAMGNIQCGVVDLDSDKTIPHNSDELPNLLLRKGDILYNRTNSYELVGKTGIFRFDTDGYSFASYLIRIRLDPKSVEPEFLNIAMNAPFFRQTQVVPKITKQTGQANVSGGAMRSMLVPIPPVAEQQRIVARVDELMVLCDALRARLADAGETRRHLADAIVERAAA